VLGCQLRLSTTNTAQTNEEAPLLSQPFKNSYLSLPESLFSLCRPQPAIDPQMVLFNRALALELGIASNGSDTDLATLLSGSSVAPNSDPIALAYAGHQYGHFTMLGDGRAILLGELQRSTPNSSKKLLHDIQLKGSGVTPYSRNGDGRAALGPMIREFIVSEAMHALGIPTTRSLAVVTTGEQVLRESMQSGAVLTRVASSHLRIGTFELAARLPDPTILKQLSDFAIARHFPDLQSEPNPYLAMLQEVSRRQAKLIAQWMGVGFIHGVMNTDNMAISGETIDFGPCAFMDNFSLGKVFSSIDRHGRYSYSNQPIIAQWNLARLAEAMLPLLDPLEDTALSLANAALKEFGTIYKNAWLGVMRAKLGLTNSLETDEALVLEFLELLENEQVDFTLGFRSLVSELKDSPQSDRKVFTREGLGFESWRTKWLERVHAEQSEIGGTIAVMESANPIVIPRNHRIQEAIEAAEGGDISVAVKLIAALENPYQEDSQFLDYQKPPMDHEVVCRTFCGT
jgi:serine/tyrosine/threonine adenylyltransferase